MATTVGFPVTMQERLELGSELAFFPASEQEYWDLLKVCEYPIEFQDNQIIAMSYEHDSHSRIANMISTLLNFIYMEDENFISFNSNRPIYINSTGAVYNPDASVIILPDQKYEYRPGMTAEITCVIAVEVLSKSTRNHDMEDKLPAYKSIDTIEHIIYAESNRPCVTVYSKNKITGKWKNIVYDDLDDSFEINGNEISLKKIYWKVDFLKK
jgi:Uma2 family endonuclease